jgi:hypothetical protein
MIENESLADIETAEAITAAEEPTPAAGETESAAAPRAKLVLKRGGMETDQEFAFGSPAIVGRFDPAVGPIDVDLGSIDEAVYVSRKHAKIICDGGIWRLEDLGSSNGTFLLRADFEKVESAELADGDEIAFGNARFVFRTDATSDVEPTELAADIAEAETADSTPADV